MSVSAQCEICGGSDVEHSCDRCGSLVCAEHFSTDRGLCAECLAAVGGQPGSGEQLPDGVDTYRF